MRQAPGYYAQYSALGNLMGLQSDGQVMLMAGMGLHGYEPRVNTLFGFPRGIRPGGVIFDLPIAGVQLTDGLVPEKTAQFSQQVGLLGSALEHATPEQMFSTETEPADAISAVKALSKANAQGQRIYQMTRDNMAETLPNLNLAIETEAEIRTALNAGLTVIAHTDNVSVPGWTGAGYIIFNPETGSGTYKISGGANGGETQIDDSIAFVSLFTEAIFEGRISEAFRRLVTTSLGTLLGGAFNFIDISQECPGFESLAAAALTTYIGNVLSKFLIGIFLGAGAGLVVGILAGITILIIVSFITNLVKQLIILNCVTRQ